MVPRHMIHWRVYVYNNGLYSLPGLETRGFREWSPRYFSHNPFELHRVMDFVNRDISILMRASKGSVLNIYETIVSLITRVSIKSSEFYNALESYFGPKTNQFIHELINFARSPYDSLMSYECNVQYKFLPEDEDGPSTSAAAKERQKLPPTFLNFVEFSRCVNPDDCSIFGAELMLEDEDAWELDALLMDYFNRMLFGEMEDTIVTPTLTPTTPPAEGTNQTSVSNPAGISSPRLDPPPATQQPPTEQQQQPQPPQSNSQARQTPITLPALHGDRTWIPRATANSVPGNDLDLELAIERSLFDTGGANRDLGLLHGGRSFMLPNQLPRGVSIVAGAASGGGVVPPNPLTSSRRPATSSVLIQNILSASAAQRAARRRRNAAIRSRQSNL
ncbi:hypothetical protein KR026_010785 [Drosophila bipectinata]|nr:hypothetical protein KR026_010785 [Drosophila bipectinata]